MGILLSAHNLGKWRGSRKLFEKISFGIEEKDRMALIGPNGAGKTTLLKILSSQIEPDEGTLSQSKNCRIAFLEQSPQVNNEISLLEMVLEKVDGENTYFKQKAYELISRFGFDDAKIYPDSLCETLSGGWRKKAALARELLTEPTLLLLDEPTNHLDIESILWLEKFLSNASFSTLTITHDRSFLQNTSTVIIDLDKCYSTGFLKIEGDYSKFCQIKSDIIESQGQTEASARNRLRREMEWMKKSPKARSTKQKSRIKKAETLQEEVGNMKYRSSKLEARLEFKNHSSSPKKLIEAKKISKSYQEEVLFKDFDLLIEKKSRIALVGANGTGKSTLIKVLLKKLSSDKGVVESSDLLEVNYFEQDKRLEEAEVELVNFFSESSDKVNFCGQWIDVRSYLARFGFRSEQLSTKVKNLSGGEKSKLIMARLMLKESNLLVLDEPTNDLDLNTLNSLEEELKSYQGALLLVSHDRYFLDQICNEIYAFSPDPSSLSLTRLSSIHQWESWYESEVQKMNVKAKKDSPCSSVDQPKVRHTQKKKKLSYKEKREFDSLEPKIQEAEKNLEEMALKIQNPEFSGEILEISQKMSLLQKEIDCLYERWEELGAKI